MEQHPAVATGSALAAAAAAAAAENLGDLDHGNLRRPTMLLQEILKGQGLFLACHETLQGTQVKQLPQ